MLGSSIASIEIPGITLTGATKDTAPENVMIVCTAFDIFEEMFGRAKDAAPSPGK